MKVFFDTNVLVSAHTTRGLSADLFQLVVAEHELLTGEFNLEELRRVLRDTLHVPASLAAAVERDLRHHTIIPTPREPAKLKLRDADDRWVLAAAVAGAADLLVTGDKDLLDVVSRAPLPILSPRACWEWLRGGRS